MRKSQMEIVGLLIIVILITLVLFFALVFLLDSSESTTAADDSFVERQLIENFGNSFLDSQTVCLDANDNKKSMNQILEDCVLETNFECQDYTDACAFFNDTLSEVLNETFEAYGLRYEVNLSSGEESNLAYISKECDENRQGFEIYTPRNIREGRTNRVAFFKIRVCT